MLASAHRQVCLTWLSSGQVGLRETIALPLLPLPSRQSPSSPRPGCSLRRLLRLSCRPPCCSQPGRRRAAGLL